MSNDDDERNELIGVIEDNGSGETVRSKSWGMVDIAPDAGDLADALLAAGYRKGKR